MHWSSRLARQSAFHVLVFLVGLLVFGWPLVSIPASAGVATFSLYVFVLWGAYLIILGLMPRDEDIGSPEDGDAGTDTVPDDLATGAPPYVSDPPAAPLGEE